MPQFILTINFDAAVGVTQRISRDTFVRAEISRTDGIYRQFHVYLVRVVLQHRFVFPTCNKSRFRR